MAKVTEHSVYLIKGIESTRRAQALGDLIERFTDPAFRDFDLERLNARESGADAILAAAAAVPFASAKRVTVIQDAQSLRPDVVETLQERLAKSLGSQSVLVFVATGADETRKTGENETGKKGMAVVRRLENLAKSLGAVITCGVPTRGEADAWVTEAVARQGKSIRGPARQELLARTGLDLGVLERELEKLAAFVGDHNEITPNDVATVVPMGTEYSVFVLVDSVAEGRPAPALQTLRGLRANNEPPQRLMHLLARQYRLLWQARMLMEDRSAADRLPKDPNLLKQSPFVQEKVRRQARNMSWQRLHRGFRLILEKDLAMKGIEGVVGDDDEALQTLIIALCER